MSSVINPKGSARDGFSRSDEYIFFVMFGECTPARLPLSNEWSSSAIVSAQEKTGDDEAEKSVEPGVDIYDEARYRFHADRQPESVLSDLC